MCSQICVLYEVVALALLLDVTLSGLLQDRHCIVGGPKARPESPPPLGSTQTHLLLSPRLVAKVWAAEQKLVIIAVAFVQQQRLLRVICIRTVISPALRR